MRRLLLNVQKEFCSECALAVRRFIGGMDGVDGVDAENGKIVIDFDETRFPEEDLRRLAKDSIERLGYKLED
jgi:copper chaperone CopZ